MTDGPGCGPIQVDGPTLRRMLTSYEVAQGECRQIRNSIGNAVSMLSSYWSGGAAQVYNDGMADWISAFGRVEQALNLLDETMNNFEQMTGITEEEALATAGNWAGVLGGTLYTDGGMPTNELLTDGPDSVMNPGGTQFGVEPRRMRLRHSVSRSRLPTAFGPPASPPDTSGHYYNVARTERLHAVRRTESFPRVENPAPVYQTARVETTAPAYDVARLEPEKIPDTVQSYPDTALEQDTAPEVPLLRPTVYRSPRIECPPE